ncbi:hypothetical protein [Trinickia terrae]|nr:hypothetical protein [Trinickia terrae]
MKRLAAIALFLAGGIATEIAHPVQCSLITVSRMQAKRKKV